MRVHGEGNRIVPATRMGVEQVFRKGFEEAKAYMASWETYEKEKVKNPAAVKPVYNKRHETMAEILKGNIIIHCHSYRSDEILMLLNVCKDYQIKRLVFQHTNEGFKVAPELAAYGAMASVFADWWAYKFEVNDAIPYNAALMHEQGITVAINSDDAEMGRRLNQEAAKTVKYGGVSEIEAWKMVTLNPAKLLHLDHRTGSIKVGKDADLVLWTTNPLSIEAKVQSTMIEGVFYFDQGQDLMLQAQNQAEKMRIIGKMLAKDVQAEPKAPFIKRKKKHFHCDTLGEEAETQENTH
jgi:imidazolonepropionase-like amidohydrolase